MAISIATEPRHVENALRKGVSNVLTVYKDTRRLMSAALDRPEGVTIALPHPVYAGGLSDILDRTLTETAQLSGWRYIVLDGDNAMAAADIRLVSGRREARFSGLNLGPFVANTVEGMAVAEAWEARQQDDFELRLLAIPSLYLIALWLYGKTSVFVVLPPAPKIFEPYGIYSASDLVDQLREPALARMELDEESLF